MSHPPLVHHDYLLGSQRRDRNKQAAAAALPATVSGDASDAAVEAALEGSEALSAADAEKDTPLGATRPLANDCSRRSYTSAVRHQSLRRAALRRPIRRRKTRRTRARSPNERSGRGRRCAAT